MTDAVITGGRKPSIHIALLAQTVIGRPHADIAVYLLIYSGSCCSVTRLSVSTRRRHLGGGRPSDCGTCCSRRCGRACCGTEGIWPPAARRKTRFWPGAPCQPTRRSCSGGWWRDACQGYDVLALHIVAACVPWVAIAACNASGQQHSLSPRDMHSKHAAHTCMITRLMHGTERAFVSRLHLRDWLSNHSQLLTMIAGTDGCM